MKTTTVAGTDGEDEGREQCRWRRSVSVMNHGMDRVQGDYDDDTDGERRRCHANDVLQGVLFTKSNEIKK